MGRRTGSRNFERRPDALNEQLREAISNLVRAYPNGLPADRICHDSTGQWCVGPSGANTISDIRAVYGFDAIHTESPGPYYRAGDKLRALVTKEWLMEDAAKLRAEIVRLYDRNRARTQVLVDALERNTARNRKLCTCLCGCGQTFKQNPKTGRPRKYAGRDCHRRIKNARRAAIREASQGTNP